METNLAGSSLAEIRTRPGISSVFLLPLLSHPPSPLPPPFTRFSSSSTLAPEDFRQQRISSTIQRRGADLFPGLLVMADHREAGGGGGEGTGRPSHLVSSILSGRLGLVTSAFTNI